MPAAHVYTDTKSRLLELTTVTGSTYVQKVTAILTLPPTQGLYTIANLVGLT
jgi:hypothetical protein